MVNSYAFRCCRPPHSWRIIFMILTGFSTVSMDDVLKEDSSFLKQI